MGSLNWMQAAIFAEEPCQSNPRIMFVVRRVPWKSRCNATHFSGAAFQIGQIPQVGSYLHYAPSFAHFGDARRTVFTHGDEGTAFERKPVRP